MRQLFPHPTLKVLLLEDPGSWEIELRSGMVHSFVVVPDEPKYIHVNPDEVKSIRRDFGLGWVERKPSFWPTFIENVDG